MTLPEQLTSAKDLIDQRINEASPDMDKLIKAISDAGILIQKKIKPRTKDAKLYKHLNSLETAIQSALSNLRDS